MKHKNSIVWLEQISLSCIRLDDPTVVDVVVGKTFPFIMTEQQQHYTILNLLLEIIKSQIQFYYILGFLRRIFDI